MTTSRSVDVLVVGAGPAGLSAAARLAASGAGRVEVLEREQQAGGVPRHCAHGGFGTWTRPLTGPRYVRLLTEAAERAGAVIRTGTSVLDWAGPDPAGPGARPVLTAVGPGGPETIEARAVVLATGARERPRTARLVPGTRPAGVYTTGELQQAVHLFGQDVGTHAVVVGAEDVSYAAAATVRAAGAEVVALVTEHPRAQSGRARAQSARLCHRVPLLTDTAIAELLGWGRLSGVRVRHRDGRTAVLACDTVVFTGDFVPDHELARRGGLALDPGTLGPAVDGALHTSRPGVFAAGNVLHAVERAGTVAGEGAGVAGAVLEFLAGTPWPEPGLPLAVEAPLRWIAPNRISPAAPPARYVLRTSTPLTRPVLRIHQDGRLLHSERPGFGTALPNRPLALTARWTGRADPKGGEVRVSVR
ncbi:oxidoreductase [Streptomyces sp. IMTB 2501]|uniref:NAD(P)/FAD-dependent oxidoreductase n=1 Tax=Streptomyces sp. IMTB 2501 TaxID=1776340 RepID=UPI00096C4046|nr:FAD-dependent oxidoreductase [Streptomyces sp. IMTB 2501]OLZ70248.1 oxidoreductase [Streptomyces sp. IMTB 2501]